MAPLPSVANGGEKTYRTNMGRSGQEERKAEERGSRLKGWRREKEKETVNFSHSSCMPASVLGTWTAFCHLRITPLKGRLCYPDFQEGEIKGSAGT